MNAEPRHPLLRPAGLTEEEADALSDARANADIATGRGVDHALVAAWMRKWGTSEETPIPPEWLA